MSITSKKLTEKKLVFNIALRHTCIFGCFALLDDRTTIMHKISEANSIFHVK